MRRFYTTGLDTWFGESALNGRRIRHVDLFHPAVGSHGIHLVEYADPADAELIHTDREAWKQLPAVKDWLDRGAPCLIATDFMDELSEDLWHDLEQVARLPHPIYESTVALDDLHGKPEFAHKKFKKKHLDDLGVIGVKGHHKVLDVHKLAKARNPLVRLSNTY